MASNSIQCYSASSSSSSSSFLSASHMNTCKYDVFVSFRGKDVRYTFVDHLFANLRRIGIDAFRDNLNLKKGESIAPELLQAIEGSRIFIVVFSKNYASSTWCLRELAKIVHCLHFSGKRVLPVFYDVDPSEVRKQNGDYEKAFAEHEERFEQDKEKMAEVKTWREALTQVASLSGWDIRNKPQDAEIKEILREITIILGPKFSNIRNDLVGIISPLHELEKLLFSGSNEDVQVVGIRGMAGVGKTTLARALYGRIYHLFDAHCFIDDVNKIYQESGSIGLQERFLSQALKEENLHIWNVSEGASLVNTRLLNARALVVLDNVDKDIQLKELALHHGCLGPGSRVIIISRDKHILKLHGVGKVYNVEPLSDDESLLLFCRKAFKCDYINIGYKEMTFEAVDYCGGLPLAIEVLGSLLFDRSVFEWRSALDRLKENPNKDIMCVLQLSFDELEDCVKEMFLDIACLLFTVDYDIKSLIKLLNYRGFSTDFGMRVLADRSLITIDSDYVEMHNLLEKLGKDIIRSKGERKWSRLWRLEDLNKVMMDDMEKNVEVILMSNLLNKEEMAVLLVDALPKMSNLKLLIFQESDYFKDRAPDSLYNFMRERRLINHLSNELIFLEWECCPFEYLPSSLNGSKLVELSLSYSNFIQLWKEDKMYLPDLKVLDLRYCKRLKKMLDFRKIPKLESLQLEGCENLVQIDPTVGSLKKLTILNLKGCKNLESIPTTIWSLTSLEMLDISECEKAFISNTHSHSESSNVQNRVMMLFQMLKVGGRTNSASNVSPSVLPRRHCLRELDLCFSNICQIPEVLGSLHCLERLDLSGNDFVTMPTLKELSRLVYLKLGSCINLKSFPDLPSTTYLPINSRWHVNSLGLYIFNCPKLGEQEHCSSMVFSWMMKLIQMNQESSDPFNELSIITQGREIPKWFNNQGQGSLISIDKSPIMHRSDCIGIVYCAVLEGPIPGIKQYPRLNFHVYPPIEFLIYRHVNKIFPSSNLWVAYMELENFVRNAKAENQLDDIKMELYCCHSIFHHWEVKNFGYRWLFKHDLELLTQQL